MREPIFLDDPHRPAVRVVRQVEHPVDEVWAAITDEPRLREWFPGGAAIDPREGGEVRFGEGGTGRVLECDPPRRLAFTWADDRLSFELEPDAGGALLTLTHDFDDRAGAASYATGWERCLGALVRALDGQPAPAGDRGVARHEQLVERFGLARPVVTRDADGWHARIERQLTAPAEVAWNAFLGTDPETGEQRSAPSVGEQLRPYAAPDVVLGTVAAVDPPHRLELSLEPDVPGDRLELGLTAGTGHGARLTLDVHGADEAELEAAIDEWGNAGHHVAREAAAWEPRRADAAV